jgi:hypothetical protein
MAVSLAWTSSALAQPWVLPRGEGFVGVIYHHAFVEEHLFAGGEVRDIGQIRTHILTADVGYGLTDRWSIRALVPYVASKYTGSRPHVHVGTPAPADFHQLDDGTTHGAIQDFRGEVRYVWKEFPVAIAPFAGLRVPSHDYEVFAHSAVGLGMVEMQVGTYLGKVLGPVSATGRVAYGIHERVAGFRRNRFIFDAEAGWSVAPRLRMFLFQATQVSHGGVEFPAAELPRLQREPWWPHHDQIGQANSVNVGAGLDLQVTQNMGMHCSLNTTADGSNTHGVKYSVTVGAIWGFGGGRPPHAGPIR